MSEIIRASPLFLNGAPGCRTLQFFQLLIEVCVKVAVNNAGMGLLELVFVQVHKNSSDVVYQLVNP